MDNILETLFEFRDPTRLALNMLHKSAQSFELGLTTVPRWWTKILGVFMSRTMQMLIETGEVCELPMAQDTFEGLAIPRLQSSPYFCDRCVQCFDHLGRVRYDIASVDRSTTLSTALRVTPERQALDSQWSTRPASVMKEALHRLPGHRSRRGWWAEERR